jgi:arylsulfatase A-like enzyme
MKNLLFICSDATRWDYLGCYGGPSDITPNLDRFARRATVFERAYSTSTWTFPAVASMFTSVYPSVHQLRMTKPRGVGGTVQSDTLHRRLVTMAEQFAAAGFDTRCIVANPWLRKFFDVTRGFGSHTHFWKIPAHEMMAEWRRQQPTLRTPWFVYIHLMDCHAPFTIGEYALEQGHDYERYKLMPDEKTINYPFFRKHFGRVGEADYEALRALYRGELQRMDSDIAELLDAGEDTCVVFTSDHGETLGDRRFHPLHTRTVSAFGHGKTPYESLIRVPLIIRVPGRGEGRRVAAPASHMDLFPTLGQLLGTGVPEGQIQGENLLPLFDGAPPVRKFVFAEKLDGRRLPEHERAVCQDGWKYVQIAKPTYLTPQSVLTPPWFPVNHRFGDSHELLGYTVDSDKVPLGGVLKITLYWRRLRPLRPGLLGMIFFVCQRTREVPFTCKFFPSFGLRHPQGWAEGEIVEDKVAFQIPPRAVPRDYAMRVGLYDYNAPKTSNAEDSFLEGTRIIGTIEVTTPPREEEPLPIPKNLLVRAGQLPLFAYIGYPCAIRFDREVVNPGEDLSVDLIWKFILYFPWYRYIHLTWILKENPSIRRRFTFLSHYGIIDRRIPLLLIRLQERFNFRIDPSIEAGEYEIRVEISNSSRPTRRSRFAMRCPQTVTVTDRPLASVLGRRAQLVAVDFPAERLVPGEDSCVRLLWRLTVGTEGGGPALPPYRLTLSGGTVAFDSGSLPIPAFAGVPAGATAQTVEQVIPLHLPDNFPEGEWELHFQPDGPETAVPAARVHVWHRGNEPNDVLLEELYDLESDPGEKESQADRHPQRLAELREVMRRQIVANRLLAERYTDRQRVVLDPEIQRQLAALGYFDNA